MDFAETREAEKLLRERDVEIGRLETKLSAAYVEVERLTAVKSAAMFWWEGLCPLAWSVDEHVAEPAINTTTDIEAALARACARLLEAP